MDVSIVIVNWNTRDILRDCLNSVYQQTNGIEVETIVIDNASSDGSAEMVRTEFPDVILIANDENLGFAAANNQGFKIAKGRYILMLNSDTVVLDGAIQKTVAFADNCPKAAAVGCKILNKDMTLQPSCFMFPSVLNMVLSSSYLYKIFPRSKFFGRERMTWWLRDDVREVDTITGCFILARREAVDEIGFLDEDYFIYGEEMDWCYRFKKAGWENIFTSDAQIIHLGGASSAQMKPAMKMQLSASLLLFMKKHRSTLSYILACFLTSVFFMIRIPYWVTKSIFSHNGEDIAVAKTYFTASLKALKGWRALSFKYNQQQ